MPRGGARKGAGRKRGGATKKTRVIADRAASEGITPLEVMLTTMREWYQQGTGLRSGKRRERIIGEAVSIAKDAAPYMHPKLSAVKLDATIDIPLAEMTDAQLLARAAQLRAEIAAETPKAKRTSVH